MWPRAAAEQRRKEGHVVRVRARRARVHRGGADLHPQRAALRGANLDAIARRAYGRTRRHSRASKEVKRMQRLALRAELAQRRREKRRVADAKVEA